MTETRSVLAGTTKSLPGRDVHRSSRYTRGDRGVSGRERAVVVVCLVVVAAHVLDDNFVQPEPGTAARDHLLSGLVPVLLLGAAATTYPHLRAGVRAVDAMTLGALAVVIGAPAAYYLRNAAVKGDHYTGLLAGVGGVVLLLAGPVILWRSRRTDGSRRRRYLRRSLAVAYAPVLGLAVAWFLVFPVGLGYIYTHIAPVPAEPDLRVPYENVVVTTDDGIELTATYVALPQPGGGSALPGRQSLERSPHASPARVRRSAPRSSGQGGSQGDTVRWAGDEDVLAGVAYLRRRPDVGPDGVGAVGFSIGGEMLLRAAARSETVRAVVSEGAGQRVGETDVSGLAGVLVDPSQAVMTAATTVFSNHGPPPPIIDHIGAIAPRPVLLIYADPGIGGESTRQPRYFAAAGEPKSIWKVPGSAHTGGLDAEPVAYERRVVDFFDDALLATDDSSERNGK